jgi:hypothetical protein
MHETAHDLASLQELLDRSRARRRIFFPARSTSAPSPDSMRMRHIAARPWVSATHLLGENSR